MKRSLDYLAMPRDLHVFVNLQHADTLSKLMAAGPAPTARLQYYSQLGVCVGSALPRFSSGKAHIEEEPESLTDIGILPAGAECLSGGNIPTVCSCQFLQDQVCARA